MCFLVQFLVMLVTFAVNYQARAPARARLFPCVQAQCAPMFCFSFVPPKKEICDAACPASLQAMRMLCFQKSGVCL